MSNPMLFVKVEGWSLSSAQHVMSEYVVASPDDIGRAAEKLGYVKVEGLSMDDAERAIAFWKALQDAPDEDAVIRLDAKRRRLQAGETA